MQRLFVWLSGADERILAQCTRLPSSERRKFAGFGTMVLIPAILGLFSMGYAIATFSKDPRIYLGAGVLWFFIVLSIDRFLSSTFYKSSVSGRRDFWTAFLFRLLFAGFIGLAVSHPLVLFLFDGTIKQKLADTRRAQIESRLKQVQELKEDAQKGPDADELKKKTEYRACLERVLEAEQAGVFGEVRDRDGSVCGTSSGEPHCGPNCRNILGRIAVLDNEIAVLRRGVQERVAKAAEATANDVTDIQQRYDEERADYIGRVNGLAALERSEPHVRVVRIFLLTFFIFLDTLLILMKATTPKGEYEEIRDSLLFEAQATEGARRHVAGAWAASGFRAVAEAEGGCDSKKEEILTFVRITNQFIKEWENERAAFDAQMSSIAHNVQAVKDEETRKIYFARLADVRNAFNAAWGKAMTRFQEYLRSL